MLAEASGRGAASLERHRRRRAQELHFGIRQANRTVISILVIVALVGSFVLPMVGWLRFSLWAGLTIAAYGAKTVLLYAGTSIEVLEKNLDRFASRLVSSVLIGGIIGSSAPLLFFPFLQAQEQLLLTMILCLWVTGAMSSIGVHRALYDGYVFIFVLQMILAWLMTDNPHVYQIAFALIVYGLVIRSVAQSVAIQVAEGIEIRFQKEELIHELEAARRNAEAANHAKSRFLAVASHDLRQPLHALTILSGLLSRYTTSGKVGEVAQQITRSVGSLDKLFSSLLDLSRLDVGAVQPELRRVSFQALVGQLEGEYRSRARAKGFAFEARGSEVAIMTDPVLFERILRNLCDNAIKYTERGKVELVWEQRSDAVVVRVVDTGPGIRPEERKSIFEEFYRSNDTSHGLETGLGLGLGIVRRLCDLLGYSIGVQSEVGVGTTFELVVPGHAMSADSAEVRAELQETPRIGLQGLGVVYIDDDIHVHAAMSLLLQDWGCRVVTATKLEEAKARIREQGLRPEVILSDYSLAGNATGIEAIEALREEYGPLPAAIITGESTPTSREKLRDSEYPVLLKPAQPEELRKLLEMFRSLG